MQDWYEKKTFGALLDEAAARWSAREALTFESQRWSFAQLRTEVDRTARALLHLGMQPGDRVALCMPNRPEWLSTFFALANIGAVVVPINTRFRASDLAYVLWQSDATTLMTVDRSGPVDSLAMVHELCPSLASNPPGHLHVEPFPQLRHVVILGAHSGSGAHHWDEVMAGAPAVSPAVLEQRHRQVDPDATVLTLYTSGTTGFPKGVMHSYNMQRTVIDAGSRMGITPRDVMLMKQKVPDTFASRVDSPLDHPNLPPIWQAVDEAGLCVVHHRFSEGSPLSALSQRLAARLGSLGR